MRHHLRRASDDEQALQQVPRAPSRDSQARGRTSRSGRQCDGIRARLHQLRIGHGYPLLLRRGKPHYLRSDNGPEFNSSPFKDWLLRVGITPIQIYPGSPWENGYNERFNGTLRREILNTEWFATIRQAQTVINQWLRQYNHVRPHHALGMRPPIPETILVNRQITGTAQGG